MDNTAYRRLLGGPWSRHRLSIGSHGTPVTRSSQPSCVQRAHSVVIAVASIAPPAPRGSSATTPQTAARRVALSCAHRACATPPAPHTRGASPLRSGGGSTASRLHSLPAPPPVGRVSPPDPDPHAESGYPAAQRDTTAAAPAAASDASTLCSPAAPVQPPRSSAVRSPHHDLSFTTSISARMIHRTTTDLLASVLLPSQERAEVIPRAPTSAAVR